MNVIFLNVTVGNSIYKMGFSSLKEINLISDFLLLGLICALVWLSFTSVYDYCQDSYIYCHKTTVGKVCFFIKEYLKYVLIHLALWIGACFIGVIALIALFSFAAIAFEILHIIIHTLIFGH